MEDTKLSMPLIKLKRAYDKAKRTDGYRILVDGLWPRGLTKEEVAINEWAKEIAPSTSLRNWFDHDPIRWEAFQKKYKSELHQNVEWQKFIKKHQARKTITLIYGTKYDRLTHAIIIKHMMEKAYEVD